MLGRCTSSMSMHTCMICPVAQACPHDAMSIYLVRVLRPANSRSYVYRIFPGLQQLNTYQIIQRSFCQNGAWKTCMRCLKNFEKGICRHELGQVMGLVKINGKLQQRSLLISQSYKITHSNL